MGEDKHLNSIKFVLISLVVYGHVNQYNILNSDLVLFVFSYFSTFAMPLFIMISGFLSKKLNWKKYKRTTFGLFLTYLVFQTIYKIPAIVDAIFGLNLDLTWVGGKFNIITYLLMPLGPLWFLLGLIVWRFIVLLISKFKISPVISLPASILMIVLSLAFMKVLLPHTKILAFLPFFLIGYYCPRQFTDKLKSCNKIYSVIILLSLWVVLHFFDGKDYLLSTYGNPPLSMYASTFNCVVYNLLFYSLALISSMAVFILTPDTFHKWGRKSMDIYLLHPLFVYPIYYNLLFFFNLRVGIIGEILISILIIVACLLISRLQITRYLLYPILLFK